MIIMLALLAALYAAGAILLAHGVQMAPEAYEDADGFHLVWQNNSPDRADVACIWDAPGVAVA